MTIMNDAGCPKKPTKTGLRALSKALWHSRYGALKSIDGASSGDGRCRSSCSFPPWSTFVSFSTVSSQMKHLGS